MNLAGKHILLGVTGGIAAYKAVNLLRILQKEGAEVRVVLTHSATKFVGKETFTALTRQDVGLDIFGNEADSQAWVKHIHWAEWADIMVIAPCTANTLGKIAHGLADNLLTNLVLALRCPLLICPTMDGEMYENPAVQRNMDIVREFGHSIMEPENGYLASGLNAKGRLPQEEQIAQTINEILQPKSEGKLSGKKVLITAGPTREYIDAVRFISNPSTGKMGCAIAEVARDLGADVTLIHGPLSIPLPKNITCISVDSASEMFTAVQANCDHQDYFVMSAAVSDFTPAQKSSQKIKKTDADLHINLNPTTDILKWMGEHRKEGQILVGFAMETDNLLENAHKKLVGKKADWIVANQLNEDGAGFAGDSNHVFLLHEEGYLEFSGSKKDVAKHIFQHVII